MKILLSPAKTQQFITNYDTGLAVENTAFSSEMQQLLVLLKEKTVPELMQLYKIKEPVAQELFACYHQEQPLEQQALLTYTGLVFKAMSLATWTSADFAFAQEHTLICSALYGLITPATLIRKYRLDMNCQLLPDKAKLVDFWTDAWNGYLAKSDVIINLASDEFTKKIQHPHMITCQFLTLRDGIYKKINTHVKMARGKFYQQLVQHKYQEVSALKKIVVDQYVYAAEMSTETLYTYIKNEQK